MFKMEKFKNTLNSLTHDLFSDKKSLFLPPSKNEETISTTFKAQAFHGESDQLIELVDKMLENIDLTNPPGVAGKICTELELYEHRALAELRPLVALSCLSMVNHRRESFGGGNLNFQCLGIALTATAKEAHLSFTKKVMAGVGLGAKISSKPRSDLDILIEPIDKEFMLYAFDEVHSFFQPATGKNAASFESGMVSYLLELCTSERFYFPNKTRMNLEAKYNSIVDSLEDKERLTVKQQSQLGKAKRILDRLENGWEDPFLSLTGYSTPINMDIMINKHNIEQGLIARFIILRAPTKRTKMTWRKIKGPSSELLSILTEILESDQKITIDAEAHSSLNYVFNYFELDVHLNHPQLGAIYARGTKWVMLIASLLASKDNIITHEHIAYATKLFMYNINTCKQVLNNESDLEEALLLKAKEQVLRYTDNKSIGRGELASKMSNCCSQIRHYKKKKKDICHVLIDRLIEDGVLIQEGSLLFQPS